MGDCKEYLALYDASWPDASKIITAFCDGFSQPLENIDFITKGQNMFVNFVSKTGSYSGSSIYYWAVYDFHNSQTDGVKVSGSLCDEYFTSDSGNVSGTFGSPRNSLIYKQSDDRDIECTYSFYSNKWRYSRIAITILKTHFKRGHAACGDCWRENDNLQVQDRSDKNNSTLSSCYSFCHPTNLSHGTTVVSSGDSLQLKLHISKE